MSAPTTHQGRRAKRRADAAHAITVRLHRAALDVADELALPVPADTVARNPRTARRATRRMLRGAPTLIGDLS